VAVTGSSGKTTVKEMIADVLSTQAPTARTKGNWNNDIGLPLSLLAMSRRDVYGVFEVGMSHPGELEPLCDDSCARIARW
jgi:UDP-N-acetylmuramoyl-tripeptide--D-alanyl-D-alanine ligase